MSMEKKDGNINDRYPGVAKGEEHIYLSPGGVDVLSPRSMDAKEEEFPAGSLGIFPADLVEYSEKAECHSLPVLLGNSHHTKRRNFWFPKSVIEHRGSYFLCKIWFVQKLIREKNARFYPTDWE